MVASSPAGKPPVYICGTYHKYVKTGSIKDCPCKRNRVHQDDIEPYLIKYLAETKALVEVFLQKPDGDGLTDMLEKQEGDAWEGFAQGLRRILAYLAAYHPADHQAIIRDDLRRAREEAAAGKVKQPGTGQLRESCREAIGVGKDTPPDFVADLLKCYAARHDPARLQADIDKLDAEHTATAERWADAPTPLVREKAQKKLAELEAEIKEKQAQLEDASAVVETYYQEMRSLHNAIVAAQEAASSKRGERKMRRVADIYRRVIRRIDCRFADTGAKGGGFRKKGSDLVEIRIEPHIGDVLQYQVEPGVGSSPETEAAQYLNRSVKRAVPDRAEPGDALQPSPPPPVEPSNAPRSP
jgi:hypothetical protein